MRSARPSKHASHSSHFCAHSHFADRVSHHVFVPRPQFDNIISCAARPAEARQFTVDLADVADVHVTCDPSDHKYHISYVPRLADGTSKAVEVLYKGDLVGGASFSRTFVPSAGVPATTTFRVSGQLY